MVLVPQLVVGTALLTLGRRLFWLFVGGVGFLVGLQLAPRLVPTASETTILVAALILGVLGAVLAVLLQRFAVGLAGFLVGGYLAVALVNASGISVGDLPAWVFFLVGGILGALMVAAVFDWALIILSSIAGAGLVVQGLPIASGIAFALWLVLILAGIVIQARVLRRR